MYWTVLRMASCRAGVEMKRRYWDKIRWRNCCRRLCQVQDRAFVSDDFVVDCCNAMMAVDWDDEDDDSGSRKETLLTLEEGMVDVVVVVVVIVLLLFIYFLYLQTK